VFYCVLWNGQQRPIATAVPMSVVENLNEVVFFAWDFEDETQGGPLMVCQAVSELINRYVAVPEEPSLNVPARHYYNYVYADPADPHARFYCGKGVGKRWREHFDQASVLIEGADPVDQDILETAKLGRIRGHMADTPDLQPEDLCKIVSVFGGPFGQAQAFAVEQYLIQHVCGVFNLTNLNGGQGTHRSLMWQSRPRSFDNNTEAMTFWCALLSRASNGTLIRLTAHDKASLILYQLPPDLVGTLAAQVQAHCPRHNALEWLGLGISAEGDLSIEANVTGTPVCLQLRFGRRDLECRINLRPGPREAVGEICRDSSESFVRYVTQIWPNAQIRNKSSHPFVKPFSVDQEGRSDIDFSVADLTAASLVRSCLVVDEPTRMSLPEALARLLLILV
jgi:hypothetical protein